MRTKVLLKNSIAVFTMSSFMFFASCGSNTDDKNSTDSTSQTTGDTSSKSNVSLKPASSKPDWGKDLTDPMAVVIEKLGSYNAPPLVSLTAQEARKQPSPADAAVAVMTEHNLPMSPNNTDTAGKDIAVKGGQIHLRVYTPFH